MSWTYYLAGRLHAVKVIDSDAVEDWRILDRAVARQLPRVTRQILGYSFEEEADVVLFIMLFSVDFNDIRNGAEGGD